jgi:RNA polymerase sigma-70 factor (ECF subfamily)
MAESGHTTLIQQCLNRLREGDLSARDDLIEYSVKRLWELTHRIFRQFPRLHRWEETDDVFQNAALSLRRALAEVHPPTAADYWRFAAAQIRRGLINLVRHYFGPQGLGTLYGSGQFGHGSDRSAGKHQPEPQDNTPGPSTQAQWTEFHEEVKRLPASELEVFDLHYYLGLTHEEVAVQLGLSQAKVKRLWLSARCKLGQYLGD